MDVQTLELHLNRAILWLSGHLQDVRRAIPEPRFDQLVGELAAQ